MDKTRGSSRRISSPFQSSEEAICSSLNTIGNSNTYSSSIGGDMDDGDDVVFVGSSRRISSPFQSSEGPSIALL